jgi:GntR family transcriptional regulator
VEKLFLADNNPVIFSRTLIPTALIQQPYTAEDCKAPIYQFIPDFCRQSLAYFLSDIVPLVAPAWLVEQFDLPQPQTALLSFEEVGYNQEHEPLVKATSYFRDDLLRLRLLRRLP